MAENVQQMTLQHKTVRKPINCFISHFILKTRQIEKARKHHCPYLAMIFAFLGYFLDAVFTLLTHASEELCLISWTYFLSGILILVFNRLCRIRASGHAAGASAAICFPLALNQPEVLLIGIPVLCLVAWASVAAKRHTIWQFIIGALIPPIAMGLVQLFLC